MTSLQRMAIKFGRRASEMVLFFIGVINEGGSVLITGSRNGIIFLTKVFLNTMFVHKFAISTQREGLAITF